MRIELDLGSGARGPAGLLVFGKSGGSGGGRDRIIEAVAGAHADGAEGAARHGLAGCVAATARREHRLRTEQGIEQPAARRRRCRDLLLILRAAVVLRQRHQDGAALPLAFGRGIALLALQIGLNAVEVVPHLLDLVVERAALLGLAAEQDEEAVFLATGAQRYCLLAVDLGLLAGRVFFELAKLLGAGGVTATAIKSLELAFQPGAIGILLGLRRHLLLGPRGQQRCKYGGSRPERAAPRQFHCSPQLPPLKSDLEAGMVSKFWTLAADFIRIRRIGLSPCWPPPARRAVVIRQTGSTTHRR